MERIVEPEILDGLPADDPAARRSRRDLARINRIMGNAGILAARLKRLRVPPREVLEIGAGDGATSLALARKLHRHWPGARVTLLDRQPAVPRECLAGFRDLGWQAEPITGDVFEFLSEYRSFDLIVANLFLHHFDEGLGELLTRIAVSAPNFVATEPRRSAIAGVGSRLLGLLMASRLTRHDAAVSVRAGFQSTEISALWPARAGHELSERAAGLFTHLFSAERPA